MAGNVRRLIAGLFRAPVCLAILLFFMDTRLVSMC